MKLNIIVFVGIVFILLLVLNKTQEYFMDDPTYQHVRNKLVGSNQFNVNDNHKECYNFCGGIKQKHNCQLLCDQYAEDVSDNYKYQTHVFGSAVDRKREFS